MDTTLKKGLGLAEVSWSRSYEQGSTSLYCSNLTFGLVGMPLMNFSLLIASKRSLHGFSPCHLGTIGLHYTGMMMREICGRLD